jgi:hypothetical protein
MGKSYVTDSFYIKVDVPTRRNTRGALDTYTFGDIVLYGVQFLFHLGALLLVAFILVTLGEFFGPALCGVLFIGCLTCLGDTDGDTDGDTYMTPSGYASDKDE